MTLRKPKRLRRPLTIITSHFNPDYDALASMVAARRLYPEALLVLPAGAEKNIRHHFVQSLFEQIQAVRPNEVDLSELGRLVVVDTRQPPRLGELKTVLENRDLDIHLYDHHPDAPGDMEGAVEVVAQVGSTVTILTELIDDCGLKLSAQEATMMAVGLYEDTGCLTFSSTTVRDYLAAAKLLNQGADLNMIAQLTVRELNPEQLSLLNMLIDSAETRQARGLSFVVATAQIEHYVDDVALLAHKMMEIMGLSILFVLVSMDNKIQLVIRSRLGSVDAAAIARQFGGGGHSSAAAASLKDMSLNQAKDRLEELLLQTLRSLYSARHLMVYPAISIGEEQTLQQARDILIKFSINVLLVCDKNERVTGFISEHNVSRAIYHGLSEMPVNAFMNTEFIAVEPEASFAEVKRIIVDRKQRVLPVVKDHKAVGVITRTDLLQAMANSENAPAGGGISPSQNRRNLSGLMRELWPAKLVAILKNMGQLADRSSSSLYAVGGCVRDLVMRKSSHDIDLTIDGEIDEFISQLGQAHKLTKVVRHPRFKTATVHTAEGFIVDISTTRREYYEHPGALPVVQTGSLRMDLYRRDFTINSLAIALNQASFGELLDFYRGYQDIKDGYIRVLHNLSFVEDPTRAFRAVRFETRLGFKISKMTASLLEGAVRNNFLTSLDRRRLLHELRLILGEDDPGPAIKRLADFGLLAYIHPRLKLSASHHKLFNRVRRVRDWLGLTFPDKVPQAWFVYLMALTEKLKAAELMDLAQSLTLKKKDLQALTCERPRADEIIARYKKPPLSLTPSRVFRLFENLSWPTVLFVMSKTENEDLSQAGAAYLTNYLELKPLISGRELITLGYRPGPGLRQTLEKLRDARLDGLALSLEDELRLSRQILLEQGSPVAEKISKPCNPARSS